MLVDLGRNDLGRVCVPGTVRVEDYSHIERYSHVMHLVSTVTGQLADGKTALDAVTACFPAGTLSGAPKVRAMELIEEVEKTRRGLYGGVLGYLDFAGNADFAIAIRTALMRGGTAYVQAGGGVVADSNGPYEYTEAANKAQGGAERDRRGGNADRAVIRIAQLAGAGRRGGAVGGVADDVGRGAARSTGWASPKTAALSGGVVVDGAGAAGGVLLAAAAAALAVRGWPLRVLAVVVAVASARDGVPGDQPVGDPRRGRARRSPRRGAGR